MSIRSVSRVVRDAVLFVAAVFVALVIVEVLAIAFGL